MIHVFCFFGYENFRNFLVIIKLLYIEVQFSIFQSYLIIYYNKDRRVFIYLFIFFFAFLVMKTSGILFFIYIFLYIFY